MKFAGTEVVIVLEGKILRLGKGIEGKDGFC